MAYLALYREWRPQLFQHIVGQEHITRTLQNALAAERVSHAYLFCGPRGTGKTTTAKVLGKALNCRSRQSFEPCNDCINCREISAGSSMDVIEIDAASHRGIDEIRELREKVKFAPVSGKYRVYIIDEVHMLTQEAFNALLKTLEEPPAHVVFILATTEPHKVPLTILSRCQRFDFHRVGIKHILGRLQEITQKKDLQIDEDALYLIAGAAEGSLRDALSILDQVISFGGERITINDIHRILGTVQNELLDEITDAFISRDAVALLELVASLVDQGKDLRLFVRELLAHLRRMLLLLLLPEKIEADSSEKDRIAARAGTLGQAHLLYLLNIFSRTEQDMRWSSQPRILLEVALVQTTHAAGPDSEKDLMQRIMRLEELVERISHTPPRTDETQAETEKENQKESGGKTAVPDYKAESAGHKDVLKKKADTFSGKVVRETEQKPPAAKIVQDNQSNDGAVEKPAKENNEKDHENDALKQVSSLWTEFLEIIKNDNMPMYMYLVRSWPLQLKGNCLTIAFGKEDELFKEYLDTAKNMKVVSKLLSTFFKDSWKVRFICSESSKTKKIPHHNQELSTELTLSLFGLNEGKE